MRAIPPFEGSTKSVAAVEANRIGDSLNRFDPAVSKRSIASLKRRSSRKAAGVVLNTSLNRRVKCRSRSFTVVARDKESSGLAGIGRVLAQINRLIH
jgi:hypothetical protein